MARRSRGVGAALVLVLLTMSGFGIWSSRATTSAAEQAVAAARLSDDYAQAANAVTAERSLETRNRLLPSPRAQMNYRLATTALLDALANVQREGRPEDRMLVERVLAEHRRYLATGKDGFASADTPGTAAVRQVEQSNADASFGLIAELVRRGAQDKHRIRVAAMARLHEQEALNRWLTPVVFLTGLVLAAGLASVTRGHRLLLQTAQTQAVHDSLHDTLTGLPNRALLVDRVEQALHGGQRRATQTGLLLLDLDRFKDINDTFGHPCGDELLRQVAARLAAVLRGADTVARLGGDEFAVLLPDIYGTADASLIATKLATALETPFQVDDIDLDVEASIGVVVSGEHGHDASTLLQRADIAMYVAKNQNLKMFVYDPASDGHSPARLALLGDLRRGLDRSELILYYQPKVSIGTGDVVGAEALVRWAHPQQGLIFPDAFIPLTEHTGLIGALTRYVLDAALAQARTWADAGQALPVSVNLSARNLLDERLPGQVAQLLARHEVPAGLLELEVTESAIMTEPLRAVRLLQQLSALGVRLSIDDFGAGYTSLGQLKDLPVDELKIDRSFVMTMTEDPRNAMIVQSVVELGHNLGLSIVAEGVEHEAALTALAGIGCDVAQGYHLCRPVPVTAFDTWRTQQQLSLAKARTPSR